MMRKLWPFAAAGLLLVVGVLLMIPQTGQAIYSLLGIDTAGEVNVYGDFEAFVPFTAGYFPEEFTIKQVGSEGHTAPNLDQYTEYYTSDAHFFKLIQSQGRSAPVLVPDEGFTIQQVPASITGEVDNLLELMDGDPDPSQFDTREVWLVTVELRDVIVQVVSNLPRQEVIEVAEGLVPSFCTSTPTPEG